VLQSAGLFWSACCCSSSSRNVQQKIGGGLPTGLDRTAAVISATAAIISAASVATIPIPVLILMPMGPAAIIPDPATPATAAVPVTLVEAMAEEEVVTAVAEEVMAVVAAAINGRHRERRLVPLRQGFFRLIPDWLNASLESLETAVFPFASGRSLKYLMGSASPMGLPIS
jgi:hypothetical protein